MIYCYPEIKGKKERHTFFENWAEVPFIEFINWQQIAFKLDELTPKIKESLTKLYDLAEKLVLEQDQEKKKSIQVKVNKLQSKITLLQIEQEKLEIQGVACFCSVPIEVLIKMNSKEEVNLTDNHLNAYKARLSFLATQKLPEDSINEFVFQNRTDQEIEALQLEYDSLGLINRMFSKKGKALKAEIEDSKKAVYKINDIWIQTTYANREFQEQANRIIEAMKADDFSELVHLVAMLTIEGSTDSKALEKIRSGSHDANSYLETYKAEFIKLYRKREELFTKQAAKLSVETVLKIKNFFLSN